MNEVRCTYCSRLYIVSFSNLFTYQAYKVINWTDNLDLANEIVIDELNEVIVKRRLCVHEQLAARLLVPFWEVDT